VVPGINRYSAKVISWVDPNSPAGGAFKVEDELVAIDGEVCRICLLATNMKFFLWN